MALDLSSSAVRLMQRDDEGGWRELGAAPLDDAFSERIDALRVEALVRGRVRVPVEIWLPSEQVLAREYHLPRGASGHAQALRQLTAETGLRAPELWVALSARRAGEPVTVLALPAQTVAEARDYVARWGFLPGRISIRPGPEAMAFGSDGPRFARLPRYPRAVRAASQAAVGAAAMLLAGLAGWGTWGVLRDPPPVVPGTAPVLALAPVEMDAPSVDGSAFAQVRRRQVQPMTAPRPRAIDPTPSWRIAGPIAAPTLGLAPELPRPGAGVPMQVGPAPVRPDRSRPAGLDRVASIANDRDFAALVRSVDGLREDEAPPATRPAAGMLVMAAVTTNRAADSSAPAAMPALHRSGDAGLPSPASGAVVRLAQATAAPRSVPAAPPPRPDSSPASSADAGSSGEVETEAEIGSESSALAAVSAPPPPARPEAIAERERAAALAPPDGDPSPPAIRDAAAKRGLELGSTSLIGVLDARSGRQALLRTPSGEFLKVGRGDTVEGWRVSSINRDAVRLTRGGQNRTLLLKLR